ncbi:hypothetical protein [Paraburkholderia gardini]|uniref:hypothetical protein n=1 Tax=Paraburkholderia gardini TaxID=2823469 RepID=UPI001DD02625|nr:hypothetical protein [Paraburkholderia gardini]CAG4902084.1 hypothetical protein R69919_02912 [Paraburkholderia gardini]
MKLTVSTPVQWLLVAAMVSAVALLLRPEPVGLSLPAPARPSSRAARQITAKEIVHPDDRPWRRPVLPESVEQQAVVGQASALPPLPPPGAPPDTNPLPPLPPLPAALAQPDVVYLGRMIKDGKVQVFFASSGDAVVVSAGEVLNGNWRVQAISTTDVTLRHLRTGETRLIAMGSTANPRPGDVAPVQVGQRFLASLPAQQRQAD